MACVGVLVICSAGCAAQPQQDYSEVRARLDAQGGQIILPLEAFAMTSAEVQEVSQANALLIDNCLAETGRTFPGAMQDWELLPTLPDRRYGLWSMSDAEENGYELPEAPSAEEIDSEVDSMGEDWWAATDACRSTVDLLPVMGNNTSAEFSTVDEGMNESFDALVASSEFETVRDAWVDCITGEGLAPHPDATVLVPSFPPAGEEQLRVAAIDTECKDALNVVQTLADYEARHQMAYLDRHEGELIAHRDRVDEVLTRARDVISTHGR